jgi:hypothetical protein
MQKPIYTMVGRDGNVFGLLGGWQLAARAAGWTPEQIKAVMDEAMSGDYDHALQTILVNSEEGDD